ncbi:MAG: hypothetical protein JOZ96_18160 [Acidobacteria bacterium]|nr:hypothetical protein [Acidobacteriota bacterium]
MSNQTSPRPYTFRCPLCLQRLGANAELILFKAAPPDSDSELPEAPVIPCVGDFMAQVRQFVGKLENNIQGGVFVSHVGCEVKNPFLVNGRIDISVGDGESCTLTYADESSGNDIQKTVAHWIIRMLRQTRDYADSYDPMWYPYLLLAATASKDSADTQRPYGNLIELAGSRSVGKTIIAVQLMQEELLARALVGARVSSREYFSPRGDSASEAFKKELYTFSNWKHLPTMRPASTIPTPGDLRAVFIERVEKQEAAPAPKASKPSERQKSISKFLQKLRALISGVEPDGNGAAGEAPRFETTRKRIPILFYDTAGESQEKMSETTKRVRELTNKLVVCIDGEELCDRKKRKDSIRLACKRLDDLVEEQDTRRRKTCVVVTKSDLIEERLSQEEAERLKAVLGLNGARRESARLFLVHLLKKSDTFDTNKLVEFLLRRDKETLIHNVFFIGTRNLPLTVGIRTSPIKSFSPQQAGAGEKVTITANTGYKFKEDVGAVTPDEEVVGQRVLRLREIRIGGKRADFKVINEETVEVTVPSDDARGFIEIYSRYWFKLLAEFRPDEANSEDPINAEDEEEQYKLKPQSTGLIRFLAWCGDIPEEIITRKFDALPGANEQQVDTVAG